MSFKFKVETENLERTVIPAGLYELELKGFKPKVSKNGDSVNLNGYFEVCNLPQAGKKATIFCSFNSKFAQDTLDFVHACGMHLEDDSLPGNFEGVKQEADGSQNFNQAKYVGPLLGKRVQAFVALREYNGTPQNAVQYFVCKVHDCAVKYPKVRHSQNLIGSN